MAYRTKTVRVGSRNLVIAGHGGDDRYFRNLGEGREDGFARVCRGLLRDDDVALDIGANIGVTAAILSEVVEKGRVHAVEAGPVTVRLLEQNLVTNGLSNVTPHHAAISDRSGTLRFHEDSAFGHVATGADGQEVPALTIDDLVRSLGLERLDFIKLDVEGSEWAALLGAAQTIARFQPIIYVEFNSWCLAAYGRVNPVEFAEWLFGNFVYVYADPATVPKRIPPHAALSLAHDNMVRKRCAENLLLSNDGGRVEPWSKGAAHRGTYSRPLTPSLRALFSRFRAWRG